MVKTGLILINLGTPESPEPSDVGRYLREFLSDPLVVDVPAVVRWPLVNLAIVPKRSHASSELYRKIWTEEGSPLLVETLRLTQEVQKVVGESVKVVTAMRYGSPSIASALAQLKDTGVERLIAFPLYPQYSLAATESSILEFHRQAQSIFPQASRTVIPAFYADPRYLDAVAEVSRPHLKGQHVVFSFHGLPEHQVQKTETTPGHCLSSGCCEAIGLSNAFCYRAQSFHTARELARRLDLSDGRWEVGFQSRLGRRPWIRPFTDEIYTELPKKGVKRVAVLVPSFTADCLETLEEVGIRGKEAFLKAGGEELTLVPSLNHSPVWVRAVAQIALPAENVREDKRSHDSRIRLNDELGRIDA